MRRNDRLGRRARWVAATLVACSVGCSGPSTGREYTERFEDETLPAMDIHLRVAPLHDRNRDRYVAAVRAALRRFGQWYGPYPGTALELSIPSSVNGHALAPSSSAQLEHDVARRIAADFWVPPAAPDFGADRAFQEGLVAFSVDRFMRDTSSTPRPLERRVFADALPWILRTVRVGSPPAGAGRTLLALLTLERYLGWPALQQSLAEFRTRHAGRPASTEQLLLVASDLVGRDLSWLSGVFDPATSYDYGIERIDTAGGAASGSRVDVVVRRYGDGAFTGSSRPRGGAFESGQGVAVHVLFADGQEVTESWDGRDPERRFVYESPVAVRSAVVDPFQVIAIDSDRANNSLVLSDSPPSGRQAGMLWAARWAAWLQDRLLAWSSLI